MWTGGISRGDLNRPSRFLWITSRRSPSHPRRRRRRNRLPISRWTNHWRWLHRFDKWDQGFSWRWFMGLSQSWRFLLHGINRSLLQHSSLGCVCKSFWIRGWRSCRNIHIIKKIVQSHWEFTGIWACSWIRGPPEPSELCDLHISQRTDGNIKNHFSMLKLLPGTFRDEKLKF